MTIGRLSNRLYLDAHDVPDRVLRELTYTFYETEEVERLNDEGEIVYDTIRHRVEIENFRRKGDRIGLHCGRITRLRRLLPKRIRWEDTRADTPMGVKLKMRNDPRYNQEDCFEAFSASNGGGLVNAPTAWGKTFFGIYTAVMLDVRTLVLASRTNWCENWLKDIYEHTNARKLERHLGRPVAGILKATKLKDPEDIFPCFCVATPQSFMSRRGRAMRRQLRRSFGMIIFDEAVMLAAEESSAVFTSFAPLWRMGLSADERRKDKKHKLTYDYCGPVVAKGVFQGTTKTAIVEPVDTGEQINAKYVYGAHWFGSLCTQLSRRRARNDLIVSRVIDDILAGYKVLVLVDRRDQALKLYQMLQDEVIPTRSKRGKGRKKTRPLKVEVLMGGDKRQQEKIRAAGKREFDVFIAMDKAVGMNTDMPGLDCCHDPSPTTNLQLLKQRTGRILRDYHQCPKCKHTQSSGSDTCGACGEKGMRVAKKWPVKIVPYKDGAYPEESKIASFLTRGWEVRMAYYRECSFPIEGEVVKDRRDKKKSYIKRK